MSNYLDHTIFAIGKKGNLLMRIGLYNRLVEQAEEVGAIQGGFSMGMMLDEKQVFEQVNGSDKIPADASESDPLVMACKTRFDKVINGLDEQIQKLQTGTETGAAALADNEADSKGSILQAI
jgi:hypothetical protein